MGERRQAEVEEPAPEVMKAQALLDAVKVIDQDLEQHQRLYHAATVLREQFGVTVQAALAELVGLEARRDALAKEVGELEAAKAKG